MGLLMNSSRGRQIYRSALRGSKFGILNIFYVFIPYLYSVYSNKPLFFIYLGVAVFNLISLLVVNFLYRNKFGYDLLRLRYLIFLACYNASFYGGLIFFIYAPLKISLFSFDMIVLLIFLSLAIISIADYISSLNRGMKKMKTYYTRTYRKYFIVNIIVSVLSILFGILLLVPMMIL